MKTEEFIDLLNEEGCAKCVQKERKHLLTAIENNIQTDKQINFIDVGCGLGNDLDFIRSNFNFNTTAIDINPYLVQKMIKKGYDAFVGKITDLSMFGDESFDIVYCSHVIEHLGYPDITVALKELYRITKKNGIIILKSLLPGGNFYNDIDHIRPYYPETINIYLALEQQQEYVKMKASQVYIWYEEYPPRYYKRKLKYTFIDLLRMLSWQYLKFPASKRTHWGLVLKKG